MTRILDIARVAHEANRAWQSALGEVDVSPPWDEAPQWQRDAASDGVRKALAGASPRELHDAWSEAKFTQGWTWGPEKNAEAKTHPCLVAYEELPAAQQRKDVLLAAIVAVFIAAPSSESAGGGRAVPEATRGEG